MNFGRWDRALRGISIAALLALALPSMTLSQAPASPSFEIVSIKPNRPGTGPTYWSPLPGGKFMARAISAKLLLQVAFRIQDFDLQALPAWVSQETFDVDAAPAHPLSNGEVNPAIRSMMEDRFKLVAHLAKKETQGYSMVISGRQIKFSVAMPRAEGEKWGFRPHGASGTVARDVSMADFVGYLSQALQVPVINNTELKDRYDFSLDWRASDEHAKLK
jgi:uncharacterized protein (TIGR03435 family)